MAIMSWIRKNKFLFCLIAIFCLALFFRIYFSYDKVFSNPDLVKYAFDDGVYHTRLVESELLGGSFPWRMGFDPFTYFPFGTYIHFAPLFDFILALVIWLLSLGKPTLQSINNFAPFIPPAMGSLVVILAYFVGKRIWDKKIGLLSAFLVGLFPSFMHRSLLGNTDHHVGEMFFSALAMMCLIFLVGEIYKKEGLNLKQAIKDRKILLLSFLTAVAFGFYLLVWVGAVVFFAITFLFFVLYYFSQYFYKKSQEWILLVCLLIFIVPFLMILPWFGNPDILNARLYGLSQLAFFVAGIFSLSFLFFAGSLAKKYKVGPIKFLVILIFSVLMISGLIKSIFPGVFSALMGLVSGVNYGIAGNPLAREFISEMGPLKFSGAFNSFSSFFFIALLSLIIIIYQFFQDRDPKKLLLIIWTFFIALMSGIVPIFGQNRFAMYLSLNVALLSSYLLVRGWQFGWSARKKFMEMAEQSDLKFYFSVTSYLILFCVLFFALYPAPFNLGNDFPRNLPWIVQTAISSAKNPTISSSDWYETVQWLKNNTPDPGIDYYSFYRGPGVDKNTGKIIPFSYPEQAYGIMAPWGVGHMITYYSHRIPISNPFQEGIGLKKNGKVTELGEGVFFLENDEIKATQYLDKLRAKYVVIDDTYSNSAGGFQSYAKWVQGNIDDYLNDKSVPNKFDTAMSTKLYYFDGSRTKIRGGTDTVQEFYVQALNHFRLVFESKNTILLAVNDYYKPFNAVKVFEYVKGAKIKGIGWGQIKISSKVITNQSREFDFENEVMANGNFEFIVPYSTSDNGQIIVKPYVIQIGSRKITVKVLEEDVLQGKEIKVY